MVDLWKNSDKLCCKWGGEHTNNNRTFVTVSREMLRNETKQNNNFDSHWLFTVILISCSQLYCFFIPSTMPIRECYLQMQSGAFHKTTFTWITLCTLKVVESIYMTWNFHFFAGLACVIKLMDCSRMLKLCQFHLKIELFLVKTHWLIFKVFFTVKRLTHIIYTLYIIMQLT